MNNGWKREGVCMVLSVGFYLISVTKWCHGKDSAIEERLHYVSQE